MPKKVYALLMSALLATADIYPDNISGSWHGTLQVTPQVSLKIGLNIDTSGDGNATVTLDSPDQSATQLRQSGIAESIVADYSDALIKMYGNFGKTDKENLKTAIDTICSQWPNNPIYSSLKANLKHIVGLSNPHLEYFVGHSPAQSIADTKCPALVMYGERDMQVSPALNMDRMKQLAPTADIKLYSGLNHLFQHATTGAVQEYSAIEETISPEVLADIAAFINSLKR